MGDAHVPWEVLDALSILKYLFLLAYMRERGEGANFGCHAIALALVYSSARTASSYSAGILATMLEIVKALMKIDRGICGCTRVGISEDQS